MQDLIISKYSSFFDSTVAIMALDLLHGDGTLRPLSDKEKITADLIMFSDILPKE